MRPWTPPPPDARSCRHVHLQPRFDHNAASVWVLARLPERTRSSPTTSPSTRRDVSWPKTTRRCLAISAFPRSWRVNSAGSRRWRCSGGHHRRRSRARGRGRTARWRGAVPRISDVCRPSAVSYRVRPSSCSFWTAFARLVKLYGAGSRSTQVELPVWVTGFSNAALQRRPVGAPRG